ncbi:MAG: putative transcriptional regulator YwtF [candidate division WS2 bacterium]|uniref:Transcriptional regulator YwtF n=1 Tax=Psychracetigena formicireducens TaxID=2986056 RepID=A0A9E2BEY3_PSYF1|nr:putative transcriptional regulator YwtF [Candidatus Psychracetigena formicireducens]MBT9144378.1 putative transcriptional regulator YwtF [Candidatus Psychracetigena formicireducens]
MKLNKQLIINLLLIFLLIVFVYNLFEVINVVNSFSLKSPGIIYEEGKIPPVLNILVSGLDSAGNNGSRLGVEPARADAILLVSLNIKEELVNIISIPRDTRVEIEGHGVQKINHSRSLGGISLLMDTVSKLLEVDIDYYFEADFYGFKMLVDELGGIYYTVGRELKDTLTVPPILVPAGTYNLNGDQALGIIRYRNYPLGDIGRIKVQQDLFKAIVNELLKPKRLLQVGSLSQIFYQYVKTDLSYKNLVSVALSLRNIQIEKVNFLTLAGHPSAIGGVGYWIINGNELIQLKENSIFRR